MKRCGYCGRENDDQRTSCAGCGTSLAPEIVESVPEHANPTVESRPRRLGAGVATIILFVYLGAQFIAGIAAAIIVGAIWGVGAKNAPDPQQLAHLKQAIMAPAVLLSLAAGGVAMICASLQMLRGQLRDRSPTGAAWTVGSFKKMAQGFAIGGFVACCFCVSAMFFQNEKSSMGPMTKMASTPGFSQTVWLIALLVAPPIEELLFRGVLYGGYRKSFGPVVAGALTTSIFVLLHITEIIHSLSAAVAIAVLALTALWLRLRSAAIGPAIALHFAYNAVIGLVVVVAVMLKGRLT
jgi:membrane protease YdiL (CAAX protease family)